MVEVVQGLKTIHAVEGKKFELDFEVIFLVELEVLRIQVFEICIKKLVFLIGSLTSLFSIVFIVFIVFNAVQFGGQNSRILLPWGFQFVVFSSKLSCFGNFCKESANMVF